MLLHISGIALEGFMADSLIFLFYQGIVFFSREMGRVNTIPCNMVNIIRKMFHK